MPLIKSKSKKAFKKNVETEMDAGKPQKQSLAIAYSMKKRAKKKMAQGGMINDAESMKSAEQDNQMSPAAKKPNFTSPAMAEYMADKFAKGGMINEDESMSSAEQDMEPSMPSQEDNDAADHYSSIADAILAKKRAARQNLAEGGMVDLDANSEEATADHGLEFNEAANLKEQYDDSQLESQPMDSNEDGDSHEEDSENMDDASIVSSIRKRMKAKRS